MSHWPTKTLAEVCEINPRNNGAERLSPEASVSFVPMAAIDESNGTIDLSETRTLADCYPGYTPFRDGDVLFAKITPCMENGKAAIARSLVSGCGFGSTEFHVLRPKPGLLPEWVFAFVRQPAFRKAAKASFTGTAGQQRVPVEFVKDVRVPVPPINEQKRMMEILLEAESLRQLRTKALQRASELIAALFAETFGSPGDNPNGWPLVNLGEIVEFFGGGTPSRDNPDFFKGVIPWATSKDMKGDYISDTQEHITEKAIAHSATQLVPAESVLVVVKSKILMHSLPVAIATVPICFGQDLKGLVCSNRVLPEFVAASLRAQKAAILAQARGANTEGLTLDMLRAVRIALPPLQLQRRFADGVSQIRALEEAQNASGKRLDDLFQSLLYRAFQGEL